MKIVNNHKILRGTLSITMMSHERLHSDYFLFRGIHPNLSIVMRKSMDTRTVGTQSNVMDSCRGKPCKKLENCYKSIFSSTAVRGGGVGWLTDLPPHNFE